MDLDIPTLITFIIYIVGMLIIGIIFYRTTTNLSDYVLGGRRLSSGVAALSAGASDMSAFMILGLPGAVYLSGMSEMWLPIGLTIGAYLNWQFLAKRLRRYTEIARNAITLPDFLDKRFRDETKIVQTKTLRIVSAFFILLFFTFYTSSGLVGGATLFASTFGWEYQTALWVGAIVVISYTFLGGFLAVSFTDFIQGILMFLGLIIVPIVAVIEMGGWDSTVSGIADVDPVYLDAFAGTSAIAIISLLAWGLGYFGQPHIITRFMAIRSENDIPAARFIGMTWMTFGLLGAVFVGFIGIAYFEGVGAGSPLADEETVYILFTQVLFNPWVAGILLAAILAAIMSTIDSQLLVSSSALTEDFYRGFLKPNATANELVWVGRVGVIVIALIATFLAYDPESTVLELVEYAWAGFGAAFGPVMLFSVFWRRMTAWGAVAGIATGGLTVIIWNFFEGGLFDLYEILPGFVLGSLAIIIVSLLNQRPADHILEEFDFVDNATYDEEQQKYVRED
ncbi:sodium/proline symporter PutP [Natribacillus halophilus]|uniref:Sodium/proline symporter n=1 Tax=Natribacillus halophilus TaxID=549003 RepID=A0A1G8P0D1_9BACI|nr:sodium/proline symporter PutP [Natribacillus halophilus]SDI85785.1 sodium/proline symporter [Natribacillus halophilus]